MFHTLQRAYREIEEDKSDDFSRIAEGFARGALMGARGNSGTILSQLLKGFADGLDKAPLLTDELFAHACVAAVKRGYASVSERRKAPYSRSRVKRRRLCSGANPNHHHSKDAGNIDRRRQ